MKPIVSELEEYLSTRTTTTNSGCIEYTNKLNDKGYGVVNPRCFISRIYGERLLHRIVWTHHNHKIPTGMVIMHVCDNPTCVREEHLKLGTQAENNKDRAAKGRNGNTKGEAHPANKLTEEDVLYIRANRGNISAKEFSKQFDISTVSIYNIWNRKKWRHI